MAARRSTSGRRNAAKQIRQQQAVARDARIMADDEIPEDLEAPITYENAMRYLRRQKLYCRGPLSAEGQKLKAAAFKKGDLDLASQINREHRGVRNPSTGDLDLCGFDLTDLIEETKHPLDGSELAYTCPKCGNQGTMRPARFNVSDRPRAARKASRA